MDETYSFEIITTFFTITEKNGSTLQLNHMKWGNNPPKYDLRRWKDGKPLKGVSMTAESLKYVCKAMAILAAKSGIADKELRAILSNNTNSDDNVNTVEPLSFSDFL